MHPALWGSFAALGLGSADFAGRFSTQALGVRNALLGVYVVGSICMGAYVVASGTRISWDPLGFLWVVLFGASTALMMFFLYAALARGPVSVVAPIVASHPVLVLAFWVATGLKPGAMQWLAMICTILGPHIVSRSGEK